MNQFEVVDGLLSTGRVQEAIQLLRQMLAHNPENLDILIFLADVYRMEMEDHLCQEMLNEVGRIAPDSFEFHRASAQQLWRMEKTRESEVHFARWIELAPHSATAWAELAVVAAHRIDEKKEVTVRGAIERALEIAPLDFQIVMLTAYAYQLIGDSEKAEVQYRKALGIQPESLGALLGLASTLEFQGDTKSASAIHASIANMYPTEGASSAEDIKELAWGRRRRTYNVLPLCFRVGIPIVIFLMLLLAPRSKNGPSVDPNLVEDLRQNPLLNSPAMSSQISNLPELPPSGKNLGVEGTTPRSLAPKSSGNADSHGTDTWVVVLWIVFVVLVVIGICWSLWKLKSLRKKRRAEQRLVPEAMELLRQSETMKDL